eukprot:scaffold1913_cov257-Pinguiococcus_pyrenoidosus.AAC.29
MGICRDSRHKRRATGGKRAMDKKKRKYEMGRQPAMTKLGTKVRRLSSLRPPWGGQAAFSRLLTRAADSS